MDKDVLIGAVEALSVILTPELKQKLADKMLDFVEETVADTANPFDDMVFLPVTRSLRAAYSIPDNDEA